MRFTNLDTLLKLPASLQESLEWQSREQARTMVEPLVQRLFGNEQALPVRFGQTFQRPVSKQDK